MFINPNILSQFLVILNCNNLLRNILLALMRKCIFLKLIDPNHMSVTKVLRKRPGWLLYVILEVKTVTQSDKGV